MRCILNDVATADAVGDGGGGEALAMSMCFKMPFENVWWKIRAFGLFDANACVVHCILYSFWFTLNLCVFLLFSSCFVRGAEINTPH